jgi:hypothetical protein
MRWLITFEWGHVRGSYTTESSWRPCESNKHRGGPKGVEMEQWLLTFERLVV